mmetsp:Transcript_5385/g.17470  ORF Transcript_5385/g.17470 Transcript_5385/m.17470 type:complete len:237 (-) Transcript_5385:2-712(-)
MDGAPRLPPRVVRAELRRPPLRSLAVRVASRAKVGIGHEPDVRGALEHPPLAILLLALLDELLGELGRVAARVVRRTLAVRVHLAHAHLAKRHPAGVAHAVRGARARLAEDADGKGVYLAHAPRTLLLIDEPGRLLGGQWPPVAHVLARRVERVVVAAAVLVAQHIVRRLEVEEALALLAAVAIRVQHQRELAVCFFDVVERRIRLDLERLIEVELVLVHRIGARHTDSDHPPRPR